MKIHFYRIKIEHSALTVADLFDQIFDKSQEQREQFIYKKYVFLERCSPARDWYELEFTQRRVQNGPGYSRRGHPTTDFPLEEDAGFGEHTAAIWSVSGFIAIQYNHHGVRPSGIRAYLQKFVGRTQWSATGPPAVVLEPVIAADALARLMNSAVQTRLECAISADSITDEMAQRNIAFGAAMEFRNATSGSKVEISVSLGDGKRGGPLRHLPELVQSLLPFSESLSRLRVNMKPDLDTAVEVLDLLGHRETVSVPDSDLKVSQGRRFTYASRIEALRTEFRDWLLARAADSGGGEI